MIPYGYCECGCGGLTNLSQKTDKSKGLIKGVPRRFILNHHRRKDMVELFWSLVDRSGDCWNWTGATFADSRYGRAWDARKKVSVLAHRLGYEIQSGTAPEEWYVCHSCDNPLCVRLSHLFLGTAQDNSDDMVTKGRSIRGVNNRSNQFGPNAGRKLVFDDVVLIKSLVRAGQKRKVIAEQFNVSGGLISLIMQKQTWSDVP